MICRGRSHILLLFVKKAKLIRHLTMSLTPNNVPTKFHLNNPNRFGEKCKNGISDPKNGHHFPKSFEVNFADKVPLTNSNAPIEFHSNTKKCLVESEKMLFQTLKMAAISRARCSLRSNSWTRCPLTLAISRQVSFE